MKAIDKYIPDSKRQESNSSTLFISLYLVLIAFFILLNSLSTQDKRREESAISSLSLAFSNQKKSANLLSDTPEIFDFSYVVSSTFNKIESTIKSSFQLSEIEVMRSGNTLRTKIPITAFFKKDSNNLGKKQRSFLNSIVAILKSEASGVRINTSFLIDSSPDSQNEKLAQNEIPRYLKIIEQVKKKGIPPQLISGGVKFNEQNNVTITFTISENIILEN